MTVWDLLIILWLPWPLLAAYAAHQRGASVWQGAFVGLFLGPLGLLVANYSGGVKCPHCLSRIHRKATRCPKCQGTITGAHA